MAYADLREFMGALEKQGELQRIKAEVDWDEEMGAVSRRAIDLRAPAPLFEKAKGYPEGYQVLGIPMGPSKPVIQGRVAIALGRSKDTDPLDLIQLYRDRVGDLVKPVLVNQAPCKEVILKGDDVDVLKFPIPRIHGLDGGRYVGTWDIVITKDPETGWVNWGTYRSMVHDSKHLCILLIPVDQHGGHMFFKHFESRGKPMPIAIVVGTEPVSTLVSITPLGYGVNEVDAAGGIRGEPVPLVKCETVDLEVPATAEIVFEGEVLPGTRVPEGPFGEYTGHAVHSGTTPVMRVTCITHRKNPVQTMANMGKPWDDAATPQSIVMSAMIGRHLADNGVAFKAVYQHAPATSVFISIPSRPGLVRKLVSTLLGGWRTGYQYIVLVDEDVDVTNLEDVWWAISTRMHPKNGISVLDRVEANTLIPFLTPDERRKHETSMAVLDATFPTDWDPDYRKQHCQSVDFKRAWSEGVQKTVLERWKKDYGYQS
jgi:4-hydroxy-3-polyprenylbenzoate decarboxylase